MTTGRAYLAHYPDICSLYTNNALDDRQDISLDHPHEAHCTALARRRPTVFDSHLAQAFNEEHDVGARVHVGAVQLLEDARVQVLVHVAVLKRIGSSFLNRRVRRAQMRQQRREALTHLERVGHGVRCWQLVTVPRCGAESETLRRECRVPWLCVGGVDWLGGGREIANEKAVVESLGAGLARISSAHAPRLTRRRRWLRDFFRQRGVAEQLLTQHFEIVYSYSKIIHNGVSGF